MSEIKAPEQVKTALHLLQNSGFEAYAVGGCVRDSLLGNRSRVSGIPSD